ncbi:unnamed protein product [Candidula unifasciata]|uniref:Elongator complex protein 4 n=1 Tax=Candidula unifasciata TaxID=100452 RepID=A0A8S3YLE9_9EUPU|nr:unnamed protein product [Candidula unifasciata]
MSSLSTTSFRKKARVKIGQILGTKPSLYNNQLLISTGIPSLDHVIGGGLAVGTVLLVEEDTYGSYAKLMLKYYVAEAVMTKQSVFLCSADGSVRQLVKELPAAVDEVYSQAATKMTSSPVPSVGHPPTSKQVTGDPSSTATSTDEKMKIAWRYQNSPKVQVVPSAGTQFGHYYDLTKTMNADIVDRSDITYGSPVEVGQMSMNPHYCQLLQEIKNKIEAGCFGTGQEVDKRSVLRIGIHSLGSPLWGENGGACSKGENLDPSLPLFLLALRGVLRTAFATAMITMPTHLFSERVFIHRVQRLADTVIRLDSFAGSDKEKNAVFKEYHGLLHLLQLPRLNSLVPAQPETSDLAFKLRRKKFTIELLFVCVCNSSGSGCASNTTADLSF